MKSTRAIPIHSRREPNGGLLILAGHTPVTNTLKLILGLAAATSGCRPVRELGKLVAEGLLMSNGPDLIHYGSAGAYVLRRSRSAWCEAQSTCRSKYPTKFPLVINLRTAKAIGLDFRQPCSHSPTK